MYDTTCFYYDPLRSGYDENLWKTLYGTTPTVDAGRLIINSAPIIGYGDITKGDITINVNVPTNPGANTNRIFGLYQPLSGASIVFIIDNSFRVGISDGTTISQSDELEWDSDWHGKNIDFRIIWEPGMAKFYVNGGFVAVLSGDNVPYGPLSLYFYNNSTDPMSIGNIDVRGARYYMNLKTEDDTTHGVGADISQSVTVNENVDIKVPITPLVFESVTVTESFLK